MVLVVEKGGVYVMMSGYVFEMTLFSGGKVVEGCGRSVTWQTIERARLLLVGRRGNIGTEAGR